MTYTSILKYQKTRLRTGSFAYLYFTIYEGRLGNDLILI